MFNISKASRVWVIVLFFLSAISSWATPVSWIFAPATSEIGQSMAIRYSTAWGTGTWYWTLYAQRPDGSEFAVAAAPTSTDVWDAYAYVTADQAGQWEFRMESWDDNGSGRVYGNDGIKYASTTVSGVPPPVNQPPETLDASGANTVVNQPTTLAAHVSDPDGNLSSVDFYISGPGFSPGWNHLANVPASGSDDIVTTFWTPTLAGSYNIHIRAHDTAGLSDWNANIVRSFTVGVASQPPETLDASGSYTVVNQSTTLTAHVSDPDGNLSSVDFYISGPGFSPGWNHLANVPASGSDDVVTTSWTPTLAGSYNIHIRAHDTTGLSDWNANIVRSFTVGATSATGFAFKILIDTNNLGGASGHPVYAETVPSNLAPLAADGVWSVTRAANSPYITDWPGTFSVLNASSWVAVETQYSDMLLHNDYVEYENAKASNGGQEPNDIIAYDERSSAGLAYPWLDTILSAPEISQTRLAFTHTPKIGILTRSYAGDSPPNADGYSAIVNIGGFTYYEPNYDPVTGAIISEIHRYNVDMALAQADCSSVTFEVPMLPNWPVWANLNEGIAATLAAGKRCYVVLIANAAGYNYRDDLEDFVQYLLLDSDNLENPDLYLVLATYGRSGAATGFLTGDDGVPSNSILSGLEYLKSLRQ